MYRGREKRFGIGEREARRLRNDIGAATRHEGFGEGKKTYWYRPR
jgi:hypothetical protein